MFLKLETIVNIIGFKYYNIFFQYDVKGEKGMKFTNQMKKLLNTFIITLLKNHLSFST